jgi:integrase/recombinase XerD
MTALAPHLASFLREHLPKERRASQHTCEAYAHCFQLLLCFAADRLKIKPAKIEIERLDAPLILAFLAHLEKKRSNSARTRNARLAAINSFFRYLEYRVPSCLDQSRCIHAIPVKKTDQVLVSYLTREELQALLDAPDTSIVSGIRDRAMLHLTFAACVGISRPPARSDRPPEHVQRAHHGQRPPRTCFATLEGDGCGDKGVVESAPRQWRARAVPKR